MEIGRLFVRGAIAACLFAAGLTCLPLISGCARNHYRLNADRDAFGVLHEKTVARPWRLPFGYSVIADPRSRLFDWSNPNDPALPCPGPDLYSYRLPQFDESRAGVASGAASGVPTPEIVPLPLNAVPFDFDEVETDEVETDEGAGASEPGRNAAALPYAETEEGLTIQPIPPGYWDAVPESCLARMMEFQSVRTEFRRTQQAYPAAGSREAPADAAPRLTFREIVELGYLNSREYQAAKESLYSAALALTLQRFDYLTKYSVTGNGASVTYDHVRVDGVEVNTLAIPSSLQADRLTALGGTIVARFANDVLLTFNGPTGYASDVSSELLFELTQSVFQRDVVLEPLIQSERNVVYAARDFARFRKEFYFSLAQTYYSELLAAYRRIELDSQNYIALVRALDQAEAEVRSGVGDAPPRFQIDQIEQDMLTGRSELINSCNALETSLDRLKLTLGLPTETPINIDLAELEALTRRDEVEVASERVRRAGQRVETQLRDPGPDREEVLSAAVVLLERALDWVALRQTDGAGEQAATLRAARARLQVDEAYEALDRAVALLVAARRPPAVPISVFRSTMAVVDVRLRLLSRQLQLADELGMETDTRAKVLGEFVVLKDRAEDVRRRVADALTREGDVDLGAIQRETETTLTALQDLDAPARQMVGAPATRVDAQTERTQALEQTRRLLETTRRLTQDEAGLIPIELSADDAMVTALVQRFDLMNQRGMLADDWRTIKLAADDLKSVLNLNVRQSFQTPNNQPLSFSFDDSRTELRASLDLPLNRRQQRNDFRQSLINYQAGRRSLMAFEDAIKFDVRQDLRDLDLDRVQYGINVVSAALASERVFSTKLELALGLGSVTARDFLEAQRAYQNSLTAVANRRFSYIVDRAQLALDLELMMLDDAGLWRELTNADYQPRPCPIYPPQAGGAYGELPVGICPSHKIKRQLRVPPPGPGMGGAGRSTLQ